MYSCTDGAYTCSKFPGLGACAGWVAFPIVFTLQLKLRVREDHGISGEVLHQCTIVSESRGRRSPLLQTAFQPRTLFAVKVNELVNAVRERASVSTQSISDDVNHREKAFSVCRVMSALVSRLINRFKI